MFDRVYLENDIPDLELREREWQTKSLENMLLDYRVTRHGELIVKRQEFESQKDPDSFLGVVLKVVREWEERVEHHGVVETYTYEDLSDGSSRVLTYYLYFAYGRLTSFERDERFLPPRRPVPRLEDDSPRQKEARGELEVDLPETIQVLALKPEGELYLVALRFDRYLHVRSARSDGRIEISGNRFRDLEELIVQSTGSLRHRQGTELEVLAEARSGKTFPFGCSRRV
jgi:hypothetical protein